MFINSILDIVNHLCDVFLGPDCSKSLINHPDYYIDNSFITHSVSPVNSLCQPYYLRHMYDEGKEDHGICFRKYRKPLA